MKNILILVLASILVQYLPAQSTDVSGAARNPFEIGSRLPKGVSGSNGGELVSSNPFDVVQHIPPGATTQGVSNVSKGSDSQGGSVLELPKGNALPKYFTLIVILLFTAFFTFAITANRGALLKAWRSFLSSNSMGLAQREAAGFVGSTPYYLMYSSFLLQAGMFVFLIVQAFNPTGVYNNFWAFLLCMLGSMVLFLSKHVLLRIVRWLFPSIKNEIERYNFLIVVFNCVLGFFLLPFNFLVAFASSDDIRLFLALWTLGLGVIFIAYRGIRALGMSMKILTGNQFHFLLYLCSAEVAPALILLKLFM
jgi:Domain of unknown function (DUF4271)